MSARRDKQRLSFFLREVGTGLQWLASIEPRPAPGLTPLTSIVAKCKRRKAREAALLRGEEQEPAA